MLSHFFERLQHASWIVAANNSTWGSAVLEVIHYFSFFVLVGSIAIVDLRIIGVAGRRQSAALLAERAFPWVWTGLGLSIATGFVMFAGDASQYVPNSVFHKKLFTILLAAAFSVWVQRGVQRWDRLPVMPIWAKLLALVSLMLWVEAILMGVNVPAITGVG
jgi:uncharacterized membrane protein